MDVVIGMVILMLPGAVIMYIFFNSQHKKLLIELAELKSQLAERTTAFEKERELIQAAAPLSVQMFPYKEVAGEDGFFSDERHAEIGYKFQVFVSGVPYASPQKVVVETLSKKEVNAARIEQAVGVAQRIIETQLAKHPAFLAAKATPQVLDSIRKTASGVPVNK